MFTPEFSYGYPWDFVCSPPTELQSEIKASFINFQTNKPTAVLLHDITSSKANDFLPSRSNCPHILKSWDIIWYCCTWDKCCSPTLLLSTLAKSLLANVPKEVFALQESCLNSVLPSELPVSHQCKQQKWPSAWFAGFQFQHCELQLLNLIKGMQTVSLSFATDL